jgi:hypothetical protein
MFYGICLRHRVREFSPVTLPPYPHRTSTDVGVVTPRNDWECRTGRGNGGETVSLSVALAFEQDLAVETTKGSDKDYE